MKLLWTSLRWILGMMATIVGAYMAVEHWVITKANTVVEPVKTHMEVLERNYQENNDILRQELKVIRHQNNSIFEAIVKKNT